MIKSLKTDGGFLRLKELCNLIPDGSAEDALHQQFYVTAIPFLMVISHFEVVNSPMLEVDLDEIHQYLYGMGGKRAERMFNSLSKAHVERFTSINEAKQELIDALIATLTVFVRVVELNGGAILLENLQTPTETFALIVEAHMPEADIKRAAAEQLLTKVQRRLGIGEKIPHVEDVPNPGKKPIPSADLPTFEVGRDMPGSLSQHGPRHDNDSIHIHEIEILPTKSEILSDRSEYLPVTDSRRWHHPGIEGLVDRQFRLLREDTVGQLRDAVRAEVQRLKDVVVGRVSERGEKMGARIQTFEDIKLEDLKISKDGLQLLVSFAQPLALRRRGRFQNTSKDRQQFWETSKCLRPESLLCLVGNDGSCIFLSVFEGKKKSRELRPKQLYDDPMRAQVGLQLVVSHEVDIRKITECFLTKTPKHQTLCEFPGVLLPAFYYTLDALKAMSLAPEDIPLSDLIAPFPPRTEEIDIGLPDYAKATGFRFELSSLVNHEAHLELEPSQPFDYATLERHSSLDRAQQTAVINALTRRLALMQGPPGT